MALDVGSLTQQMLNAALPMLKKDASDAESFAKTEFTKIAQTLVSIEGQLAAGEITQPQADLLLDMQKNASRAVLLALKGMSLLAAEQAINAALGVIASVVNAAVHFPLIS
jgi:hypothetical protein